MLLASFRNNENEPSREILFHQSFSGVFRCTPPRHMFQNSMNSGDEWDTGSRMARGQHDAWVEEVETIFEPVSATEGLWFGGTLRTTTPLCYCGLPCRPALRHGTGTFVPSRSAVATAAISWSVTLRPVQSLVLHFCKHSSKPKAVSVGCQGRLQQRPVDHLPHVSSRIISGMPSLASVHNQRVHSYTTMGWNALSTQAHFVLPVFWAS